jgi:predicted RNA-binding protein YlxR (DUF448 family)
MKTRKIPLRMCLGCQEMKPKKELLRIVKTPEGTLEYDPTSKKNGRGAYLCNHIECLTQALKYHKFEKTFGAQPSAEMIRELERRLNSS